MLVFERKKVTNIPYRPNTPCRHPGCPALVPHGQKYCDAHKPLHPEGYLEAHPLCVECMKEGRYVRATDVDHIVPHRGDRLLFWDQSNWQPLCHRHHSIKTRTEDHAPAYHY